MFFPGRCVLRIYGATTTHIIGLFSDVAELALRKHIFKAWAYRRYAEFQITWSFLQVTPCFSRALCVTRLLRESHICHCLGLQWWVFRTGVLLCSSAAEGWSTPPRRFNICSWRDHVFDEFRSDRCSSLEKTYHSQNHTFGCCAFFPVNCHVRSGINRKHAPVRNIC